jgi:hypothetical protein
MLPDGCNSSVLLACVRAARSGQHAHCGRRRTGQVIDRCQQQEGYGTAVTPHLARDLHNELPEEIGFSERSIKRMLAFYRLYPRAAPDAELVPQPVAQAAAGPGGVADLPLPAADFSRAAAGRGLGPPCRADER